jgi:hypothetical protein
MRWLDDVESDLKKMEVKGWKEKMRERAVETGCRGGQGSPRAVVPSGRHVNYLLRIFFVFCCCFFFLTRANFVTGPWAVKFASK